MGAIRSATYPQNKNTYGQSWLFAAAAILSCLILLGAALPRTAFADPMDALSTAQKGIDQCDPELFRKAVDIDSVFNSGFDALISALRTEVEAGNIGGDNALLSMAVMGLSSGDGNTGMLKQLLNSEAKSFVASGISGGYFAGKPNGKGDSGSFSSLLKDISKGRKQLSPGKVLTQKDGQATITASLIDGDAGKFPLKLRLEETSSGWQVKEVLNAQELLQEAQQRR